MSLNCGFCASPHVRTDRTVYTSSSTTAIYPDTVADVFRESGTKQINELINLTLLDLGFRLRVPARKRTSLHACPTMFCLFPRLLVHFFVHFDDFTKFNISLYFKL